MTARNGTAPPPALVDFARVLAAAGHQERTQLLARAKMLAMNGADPAALAEYEGQDPEGYRAELVSFDTIEAKWTDWVWERRIPRGMLTLLVGTEGLGKSAVTLRLAALASRGALPGDLKGDPARVALVTVEDDPERTMRPRLEAAGADLSRVSHFRLSKDGQDAGLVLPRDAGRLGRTLGEADVRLVIIDPLVATLDPRLNSYKDTDVREALTPLLAAAGEHDFAVLGVLHTNKSSAPDARTKAMGSRPGRSVLPRAEAHLGDSAVPVRASNRDPDRCCARLDRLYDAHQGTRDRGGDGHGLRGVVRRVRPAVSRTPAGGRQAATRAHGRAVRSSSHDGLQSRQRGTGRRRADGAVREIRPAATAMGKPSRSSRFRQLAREAR